MIEIKERGEYTEEEILRYKIEGLILALKATINKEDIFKLEQQIKQYATKYKEVTGEWYQRTYR